MTDIQTCVWPIVRLAEAIEVLARRAGFHFTPPADSLSTPDWSHEPVRDKWLESACGRMGIEVESVTAVYAEVDDLVRKAGPALLQLPDTETPQFLLIVKSGRWRVSLIAPDLSLKRVDIGRVASLLKAPVAAPLEAKIDHLLAAAHVAPERAEQAKQLMLNEQLGGGSNWRLLATAPGAVTKLLAANAPSLASSPINAVDVRSCGTTRPTNFGMVDYCTWRVTGRFKRSLAVGLGFGTVNQYSV